MAAANNSIYNDFIVYDPEYVPDVFPLANTGAICWCNSALQALLSCSALNKVMLDNEEELKKNKVANTYINIIKKLLPKKGQNVNQKDIFNSSSLLINAIASELHAKKRTSDLTNLGQQDADEGIQLFLDLIDYNIISNLFRHRYNNGSYCTNCEKISYYNTNEPPNIVMNLELTSETDSNSFTTLIKKRYNANSGYTCDLCKLYIKNTFVVYELKMLREIIIIRILNTNSGLINKQFINYPDFIEFDTNDNVKLIYKLVAQVEHMGGQRLIQTQNGQRKLFSSSGHYITKCFRGNFANNEYAVCNDSNITTNQKFSVSKNTYILIYNLIRMKKNN